MIDENFFEYDPSFLEWLDRCVAVQVDQAFTPTDNESFDTSIVIKYNTQAPFGKLSGRSCKNSAKHKYSSFGSESYDHLLMPYLSKMLVHNTTDLDMVLQRIICDLFFNMTVRKNNNIFIPKDSYNCITVWSNGSWKSHPLQAIMEKMVRRGNEIMQRYLVGDESMKFQQEIGQNKYDALLDFTNKIHNLQRYPEMKAKLLKDTEHTILTNQHIVHGCVIDNILTTMPSSQQELTKR